MRETRLPLDLPRLSAERTWRQLGDCVAVIVGMAVSVGVAEFDTDAVRDGVSVGEILCEALSDRADGVGVAVVLGDSPTLRDGVAGIAVLDADRVGVRLAVGE